MLIGLPIALFDVLNPGMMLLLGAIAVLLFGERLPEAARSFGQKFLEVKKSFQSIQDELRSAASSATSAISSGMSVHRAVRKLDWLSHSSLFPRLRRMRPGRRHRSQVRPPRGRAAGAYRRSVAVYPKWG